MIDFDKLTDADIRQLVENAQEVIEPLERVTLTGTTGDHPCPALCGFKAKWIRSGAQWSAECDCGWSAAGWHGSRVPKH